MPWISEGGNGGSWKPGNGGPWGQKPGTSPPDFEEFLRKSQEQLKQFIPSGGGFGARGILALVLVGIIAWLLSGFYTIEPNEVGLNKIFGAYTGKTSPGLNYNLPFPIGSVQKLKVTHRQVTNIGFVSRQDARSPGSQLQVDLPEESLMLTGDENIADVKFVVVWQIDPVRPEDYAFNIANQRETVKAVAESAMREVIGRSQIQKILTAERKVIELHGNIQRAYCTNCEKRFDISGIVPHAPDVCDVCVTPLRPDVVLFGEMLPLGAFEKAEKAARASDLFFVIGTSALVYPAAGLAETAKRGGAFLVEINPEETPMTGFCDETIRGKAGEILPLF